MGRASTEMEEMRRKMVVAVDRLTKEEVRAMVLRVLSMANTYEMEEMAKATRFSSFEEMDFELDLTA